MTLPGSTSSSSCGGRVSSGKDERMRRRGGTLRPYGGERRRVAGGDPYTISPQCLNKSILLTISDTYWNEVLNFSKITGYTCKPLLQS
jgi:hypothetical protein